MAFHKLGKEGTSLTWERISTKKSPANTTLNEKTRCSPTKIRSKARMSAHTTPIQHHTGSPEWCNKTGKGNKKYIDWEEKQNSVCTWCCLHGRFQRSTKKLLELISNYSKVSRYKVNTQKSSAFLYTGNKQLDLKLKTIPFTLASPKIKY